MVFSEPRHKLSGAFPKRCSTTGLPELKKKKRLGESLGEGAGGEVRKGGKDLRKEKIERGGGREEE